MPKITVSNLVGTSSVITVQFTVGGKPGSAKAYLKEYQKDTQAWVVGQSYDVEFEKKQDRNGGEETWMKKTRPTGGSGGGGKTDPAKLELERQRLELEKQKAASYNDGCEKNRDAEQVRQAGIMAQFAINRGCELTIANIKNNPANDAAIVDRIALDINEVSAYAKDILALIPELQDEILASLKARSLSGP